MRLVSVGNYFGVDDVFADMFDSMVELQSGDNFNLTEKDVVVFGGGADICPAIYKARPIKYCHASHISPRDQLEINVYDAAIRAGAKMVGICRGAQLLCAKSGGSLIQHVSNHAGGDHRMMTVHGEVIWVSSAHHQMMNPQGTDHELIAWSHENRSRFHLVDSPDGMVDITDFIDKEPEVVFFKDSSALAIQYHPEFMSSGERGFAYAKELVDNFIINRR